jgi:hypothetical protein
VRSHSDQPRLRVTRGCVEWPGNHRIESGHIQSNTLEGTRRAGNGLATMHPPGFDLKLKYLLDVAQRRSLGCESYSYPCKWGRPNTKLSIPRFTQPQSKESPRTQKASLGRRDDAGFRSICPNLIALQSGAPYLYSHPQDLHWIPLWAGGTLSSFSKAAFVISSRPGIFPRPCNDGL